MTFVRISRWAVFPVLLGAGFLAGWAIRGPSMPTGSDLVESEPQIRLRSGVFTRPLLECEGHEYAENRRELHFFKPQLKALVAKLEGREAVEQVAVYFRDLDNGPWFGVKEEKKFTPASLFKVPLIIGCLKQAENDPSFLGRRIRFEGFPDPALAGQVFFPKQVLEVGKEYTVADLMERTAVYSDNGSAQLLYQNVDWEVIRQVCLDLGIDPTQVLGPASTLSATAYGRFFRVLYNASYLSREDSETALELFTRSTFREGLVAGLPEGVVVSHKFGERGERVGSGNRIQLHDCGIIYFPGRPYLLCVMTEGYDFSELAAAISEVSRYVYGEVARNEPERVSR